jgi:hypothetical protein
MIDLKKMLFNIDKIKNNDDNNICNKQLSFSYIQKV